MEDGRSLLESGNLDERGIKEASEKLNDAKALLVPKMKTSRKIIFVLGLVICILLVIMIYLSLWSWSWKRKRKRSKISDEETEVVAKKNSDHSSRNDKLDVRDFGHRSELAFLYWVKTKKRIVIGKPLFTIGKREDNDLTIPNRAVSRRHARFIWEGDYYYIEDLDSANGTMVNGRKVKPGTKFEIHDGSHIVFADEKFIFELSKRTD